MKNTTKTIAFAFAVFLVAALFVGAASATTITATGQNAFIYDKITVTGQADATFGLFEGGTAGAQTLKNSFKLDARAQADLSIGISTSQTGTYQKVDPATGQPDGTFTIYIWNPTLTLRGELGGGSTDSIDGKTITKITPIKFVLEAPKVGTSYGTPGDFLPTAKIVFTTPAGGKTTMFGSEAITQGNYNGFNVNADKFTVIPSNGGNGDVQAGQNAVAGVYVAVAEFVTPAGFNDYAPKSNAVSFTVQSTTLTLTANKDSVVRSNPFTVTLQGVANDIYFVYLERTGEANVPVLQEAQSGMKSKTDVLHPEWAVVPVGITDQDNAATWAYFSADASGKRTVQYNTDANTEDRTYTVKVTSLSKTAGAYDIPYEEGNDNDKVKVKVEKGAVTITASGDRSYYIGEEIKLTGTNTDSANIWLFITGPNLIADGEQLLSLPAHYMNAYVRGDIGNGYRVQADVSVKTDNTWEHKWNTAGCGLDTGAYTIYATSKLTNGKSSNPLPNVNAPIAVKLSDAEYATVSVNLKQPFLSAVPSGTTVAKGDKIYIRGTAEGDPSTLQLYIFGPNKYVKETISVEDDGSYEKKLEIGSEWSSNQYFVVIEHPMYNNQIDVYEWHLGNDGNYYQSVADIVAAGVGNANVKTLAIPQDTTRATAETVINGVRYTIANTIQESFIVEGNQKLQGSNAADALTKMIDSPNIDDIYTKLTFSVAEPWIKINNPGDQAVGTSFTITGTTNLAVDDQILIEVVSSSFNAIDKTSTSQTSGFSQTTKVVAGNGTDNAWSIDVDTTNFKLDEYTIKANGIETDVSTTANFNIVEKVNPTVTPTATVTGQPTTTATTAVPTDAPKTPGFGAFIALAGLGAVALLVLRRN